MISRLLLVSMCVCAVAAQHITQDMRNCRNNHADRFSECFMKIIKRVQPQLGKGIAEINLPPLEPLLLDNLRFRQSFPPVTVEAIFRHVKVYGVTAFDLKYLNVDFATTRKQSVGLTIPSLTAKGQYKIGGNVFLLPIEGDGDFTALIDGVVAEGTGDIVREKGKIIWKNVNIVFKLRSIKIRMDNLFPGNQVLNATIHHFMNENSEILMDLIRPSITSQLNVFFNKVFNSFFSVLPPDVVRENPRAQQGRVQRRPTVV